MIELKSISYIIEAIQVNSFQLAKKYSSTIPWTNRKNHKLINHCTCNPFKNEIRETIKFQPQTQNFINKMVKFNAISISMRCSHQFNASLLLFAIHSFCGEKPLLPLCALLKRFEYISKTCINIWQNHSVFSTKTTTRSRRGGKEGFIYHEMYSKFNSKFISR